MTEKTVRVKMLKARVWDGSVWPAETTVSVPESVAAAWIAEQAATLVEKEKGNA
jgi:hypothetical protein